MLKEKGEGGKAIGERRDVEKTCPLHGAKGSILIKLFQKV
jgi:hypothetical protein